MGDFILRHRKKIIWIYAALAVLSGFMVLRLQFSFDFEQLFPKGDPDLEFFREFTEDFESDDSFLLIAVENEGSVWDSTFLDDFHQLVVKARRWPYVKKVNALTLQNTPLKTPLGLTALPVIHRDKPELYAKDSMRVERDKRFKGNLITKDSKALVIAIQTEDNMGLVESAEMIEVVEAEVASFNFDNTRYLGRPFFQTEMVNMQLREIIVTSFFSIFLVFIVMFLLFRKWIGIFIALGTVGMGLVLLMGFFGLTGRELTILSALYPLLMVIVGTSDVIHIMSKYIDEMRKGNDKPTALKTTIREIGLATLLTSVTTAVGYGSLCTSKIGPVSGFGINAAIGVMLAYIIVITGTVAVLSYFVDDDIVKGQGLQVKWTKWLEKWYQWTRYNTRTITIGSLVVLGLSLYGVSLITTNFRIVDNLPNGRKVTEDYLYFEDKLSGFRPMEVAIATKDSTPINTYAVMSEVSKLENYLSTRDEINSILSFTDIYRSLEQAYHGNQPDYYKFPEDEKTFNKYKRRTDRVGEQMGGVMISNGGDKMRVSTRMADVGADNIKAAGIEIDQWISQNMDTASLSIRRTGTGLILDKNSEYVRDSLIYGLAMAIAIVSLLMVLLFRDLKMLIISIVPNLFPLVITAAILGYLGIELEAGISIVFAISFGIAVDDTIHFLSKFKLMRGAGHSVEESIHLTFVETGKAIALTTIILFFGFLVLLFSIHPPSVSIGVLISVTLVSALIADMMVIPVLIRALIKD